MWVRFCLALFFGLWWTLSAEGSTQASLVQVVRQAPTTTYLQVPASPAHPAGEVTVTIQVVSSNGLAIPNGAVTVSDGSTSLGEFAVSNGKAIGAVSVESLGTHELTACYLNSDNYAPSCSDPVMLTSLPPYTLQQGISSSVLNAPSPFVDKLKVIPANGFVGIVQLACQVPAYKCSISPSSVAFFGDGQTQTVQVSFIPSTTTTLARLLGLPLIGLIRIGFRRRASIFAKLIVLTSAGALLALTGCGPIVSLPLNIASYTMLVNSTSGTYSQAVSYDIHVDTVGANQ
jgi:Bacterial Ig-like domain (group 3)